jgi:hypothetical protein
MNKESSIVPRVPYWLMKDLRKAPEKEVFLNDKNLNLLKGYKAYVQANNQGEIHLAITGLSDQTVTAVFNRLEALSPKEIASDQ